jgi:polyhydroxybutyrate depolymerase
MIRGRHIRRTLAAAVAALALFAAMPAAALSFLPFENVTAHYTTITHGGITRTVGYLRPAQYRANAPAIIALHFNLGVAPSMANLTEIGELVRDTGAWVILPQAHDHTWSHDPTDSDPTDDAAYLATVIDQFVQTFRLDARRIYMAGYSQGGNMTVRFACEYPGKIAAGASVAATMRKSLQQTCAPAMPTPMAFFNGTDDEQVPYNGGLFSVALSAPAAAQYWADVNQCGSSKTRSNLPAEIDDGTSAYVDRYDQCPAGRAVELYTITKGGHTWPGVLDFVPAAGLTTQNLSANKTIWEFFRRFSR